ncbi:SDR family oxidoreductase [Flavobacterium sp. J49]|uniref:SDR family oxidoreductase n=1 Tax=Flavobacterium sp. J49 TaxID=2718534 RepID=UPI001593179F|nr:SDR family oxidoreductase [Flavobacterium sp. J49]MBF6641562.1 SDR family oxidoreductase [Flavobacterium sp. J49]NIC02809.1 SDR family oxidoreductase [Flavobacterium sp. J49]
MKKISILGCGWLGLPLAKSLIAKGFLVKGSTTSSEKITLFQNAGINAFQITLSEHGISGDIDSFLSDSEILILDIPPKLRGNSGENFIAKIQQLIPFIEKAAVQRILFVSSTSVYTDDNSVITEKTKPKPDTESGKQLWETEQLLQSHSHFKTTVVRFGGLIGEDRHPIYFLAGRQHLENPNGPINLIHQIDCIGIIESIIEQDYFGETFNAVTPFHPTRKDYYSQKATTLGLSLPEFDESKPSVGKTILSDTIATVLGYEFQNKSL